MELLKFPYKENLTPDVYHAYRKFSDPSLTTVTVVFSDISTFGHRRGRMLFLKPHAMLLKQLEFISIGSHS